MIFASNMWAIFWIPSRNLRQVCYAFMNVFYNFYSQCFPYFPLCRRTRLKLGDAAFKSVFMFGVHELIFSLSFVIRLFFANLSMQKQNLNIYIYIYIYIFILIKTRFISVKTWKICGAHWYVFCVSKSYLKTIN